MVEYYAVGFLVLLGLVYSTATFVSWAFLRKFDQPKRAIISTIVAVIVLSLGYAHAMPALRIFLQFSCISHQQ